MTDSVLNLDDVPPAKPEGTFILGGREWNIRSSSDMRQGALNRIFNHETGNIADAVAQVGPFFKAMIADSDWPDFEAMMNDEDSPLTKQRADLLVPYLIEKVLGLPTKAPSTSTTGRTKTGSRSRAVSSSRATRRKAS